MAEHTLSMREGEEGINDNGLYGILTWYVEDEKLNHVAVVETREWGEFIVQACNNFEALLAAAKDFVDSTAANHHEEYYRRRGNLLQAITDATQKPQNADTATIAATPWKQHH